MYLSEVTENQGMNGFLDSIANTAKTYKLFSRENPKDIKAVTIAPPQPNETGGFFYRTLKEIIEKNSNSPLFRKPTSNSSIYASAVKTGNFLANNAQKIANLGKQVAEIQQEFKGNSSSLLHPITGGAVVAKRIEEEKRLAELKIKEEQAKAQAIEAAKIKAAAEAEQLKKQQELLQREEQLKKQELAQRAEQLKRQQELLQKEQESTIATRGIVEKAGANAQ